MAAPRFSCSSPSSSSLLRVLVGGSVQVGSWWCSLVIKKQSFLNCWIIVVLLFSKNRVCRVVLESLWDQLNSSGICYFCLVSCVVTTLYQPIWQFSVDAELFLDPNLMYPSGWWGLSAVNIEKWTTCLPASVSVMHIKWVLTWEWFLLE